MVNVVSNDHSSILYTVQFKYIMPIQKTGILNNE